MAQEVGFEPTCLLRQPDFESGSLWPLRYSCMSSGLAPELQLCVKPQIVTRSFYRVFRPSITLCHEVTLLSQPYGMSVHWLLILCLNHMGIRWALSSQCFKYDVSCTWHPLHQAYVSHLNFRIVQHLWVFNAVAKPTHKFSIPSIR